MTEDEYSLFSEIQKEFGLFGERYDVYDPNGVKTSGGFLKGKLKDWWKGKDRVVHNRHTNYQDVVTKATRGAQGAIADTASATARGVETGARAVGNASVKAGRAVAEGVETGARAAKNAAVTTGRAIGSGARAVGNAASNAAQTTKRGFFGFGRKVKSGATSAVSATGNAIGSVADRAASGLEGAVQSQGGRFGKYIVKDSLTGKTTEVGGKLTTGLFKGLKKISKLRR